MIQKAKAKSLLDKLYTEYADVPLGVDFTTPFQLIVGVILSAQCTDERVNQVTSKFFTKFKTAEDFCKLSQTQLEVMIRPTGFFRNKAKSILGAAHMIAHELDGRIPETMEELVKIPGFGRKTANVILVQLFGKNEGVCVDTHVLRLSKRLGLSRNTTAESVEKDLMRLFATQDWHRVTHALIWHGRKVCSARSPKCQNCVVNVECPKNFS